MISRPSRGEGCLGLASLALAGVGVGALHHAQSSVPATAASRPKPAVSSSQDGLVVEGSDDPLSDVTVALLLGALAGFVVPPLGRRP